MAVRGVDLAANVVVDSHNSCTVPYGQTDVCVRPAVSAYARGRWPQKLVGAGSLHTVDSRLARSKEGAAGLW